MNPRFRIFAALAISMCALSAANSSVWAQAPAAVAARPSFNFNETGLEVDAGALGKFTLEYPALLDATKEKPAHNLVEKAASGAAATLRYEGGTMVSVEADINGNITMKFPTLPSDVKAIGVEMKIPIEFGDGGSWKIGASGGPFPKDKPSMPHLYQDHARSIEISKAGHSLRLETPEYSFLQLTDNREWNWVIYNFRALVPAETIQGQVSFTVSMDAAAK